MRTRNDIVTKIFQINALAKEILEYVQVCPSPPNALTTEAKTWVKLGYSNRLWDSKFDEYEYNMQGSVRRNGRELKVVNCHFSVSIDGEKYHLYMPARPSIRITNPLDSKTKALICNDVKEASEFLGISKYYIRESLHKKTVVLGEGGIQYRLTPWYPSPYLLGDKTRKDLIKNEKK